MPRFLVDHMLVKLGAYLRIVGCDAAYHPGERTHELIRRADLEERVFLTRNTHIPEQYPQPHRMVLLPQEDPVQQLHTVLGLFSIDPHERLFTRCIRCNVDLEFVEGRESLAGRVPERVLLRYERFWRCPACETVFWRGTHVQNTCRKLGLGENRLSRG